MSELASKDNEVPSAIDGAAAGAVHHCLTGASSRSLDMVRALLMRPLFVSSFFTLPLFFCGPLVSAGGGGGGASSAEKGTLEQTDRETVSSPPAVTIHPLLLSLPLCHRLAQNASTAVARSIFVQQSFVVERTAKKKQDVFGSLQLQRQRGKG